MDHQKEPFDEENAKIFLFERERTLSQERENIRIEMLKKVVAILVGEFGGSSVEVFLVGSIIRPFQFTDKSDVDIVLKNFQGDRFEIWPKLEQEIGRAIEIIKFENCHFQEFILQNGLKVV